ncbi:MAG: tetratricopeptide repeat protein [Deltaproteobacteria bacterium]|nr:MAG: tetratricopeptide repeat protein [Deltaproteobacteria bacterium]
MSTAELYAAFESNPSDYKAFEALIKQLVADDDRVELEQVYGRVPSWAPGDSQNALIRVLHQVARTSDGSISSFLHYQNGLLLWQEYAEPQKAEMSFRKVEEAPADPTFLRKFYLEYYIGQNNWRRLEQFLSEPQRGGLEDQVEVKRMLGHLAIEHDQPDKAITFWQGVLQSVPDDAEAEGHLRALFAQVGKWHAMVDLLKEKLDRSEDRDTKIALLLEMIDLYKNKMNAASKVVSAWQQVLDIDPSNRDALDALADEYTEMKRWPDLVRVIQQKIEHEQDPIQLIALYEDVASIMLERFSNTGEAIKAFEAILELDPENARAIRELKDIYEQRRDWDNYILIVERELGLLPEGEEKNERFVDLARLASERIRKPQTPITLWERVLNRDAHHAEALEHLEQLYEREKNFKSLASILEMRVSLAPDAVSQVELLEKLGMVTSIRLHDQDRSAEVWKQILERDPEHRKAQAELKKKFVNEHDWDGLEWFFRQGYGGGVTEWVRTLESQAKSVEDPAERTTLLFKSAGVWKDELDDQRRAVKNLENVLELAPDHADAARMLIPMYRELESWRQLPPIYDIVLEASDDPSERREILLAQAEVQEIHLGAPDAAFFAYVQAVSEAPGAIELHPELLRLAEASQNWESYVYVLQEAVERVADESDKIDVLLEIGRVYRDYLEAPDTALTFFNRVLSLDEYNRAALDAAEQAWSETDAYDQLILVYEKKLHVAESADEKKELLFRLSRVWRDRASANDEAEAILREMLEEFADDVRVHDDLITIYLEEERYPPLLEVLGKKRDVLEMAGASSVVLADIECQLGMLVFGTRGDDDGVAAAVDRYQAALEHDPAHATSVERLEELLADEAERQRISHILEPIFENGMAWPKLAQVLEIQLQQAVADESPSDQAPLLERLSLLYRDAIGDTELAWRSYARLFELQPESAEVRSELLRFTNALERWKALVDLYSRHADEPLDQGARLAIKLEVARTWHKRLASLEDARVFYHKVLDEEPEHQEALDALEGIYVDLDRAEDLLGIYRRKIELTEDLEQKLDYLFRTSDLLRDRLERPEDAIAAAREALDLVPGHLPAIQRLDELYTLSQRWDDLGRTLEETIEIVADDAERVVLLKVRLAGVHEQHLDDAQGAIELYASVFELDPDNLATVEALERLFEDDALAPAIAPILQPYYDRRGDWQRLIDVYAVREAVADDVDEKVAWNYKIAELYELLGEMPESAFTYYEAAAALDPGNERTVDELLRLGDVLDNHGELIHFLTHVVEEIPDDGRRIETHRTIAALARDKTRDVEGAEKQLRAILEIDPADLPATDDLIALYRSAEQPDKLVEMLLHKAPMNIDAELRQELYAEAGHISADVLQAPEQAIDIFETLHGLDPNLSRALDALEDLYERVEDWDNLVRIYREKIDRTEDIGTKKLYAGLMGHVQADKLESADDAIFTWHRVLEWDPAELDALVQLDRLYSQQGDWFNLLDVLRKTQDLVEQPGWEDAQFRIAKLFENEDQLADITQAIDAHGALLAKNPAHAGATGALKTILAERDAYEHAFSVLRPVLADRGLYEDLWEQYEVLAGHLVDEPQKYVDTLHDMAQLAELQLLDPVRALEAQSRAFVQDPRNELTIIELERLAEDNTFWEELVGIYRQGAEDTEDDLLGLQLRLKVGAILMDRIADPARAIAAYAEVYKEFPDNAEALSRLHELYESQGMAPELAGILRQQIDVAVDLEPKLALIEKLARVSEVQLENNDAAYEAWLEMLDFQRNSPLAVAELRRLFDGGVHRLDIGERLEPIYREQERWEELDTLLQLKLEVLSDPVDRMQLLRDIAILNLEMLGRRQEALAWYGEAFRLDPEDEGLHIQLRGLAEETGRWDDLLIILIESADACEDADRKLQLWHAAAEVARDQLEMLDEAERIYRVVLDADEANLKALQALDALYTAAERWVDLEPVLVRETQSDDLFDDERIRLFVRLAELYRDRLGDLEKSVAAWRAVLELNDIHEQALKALQAIYAEGDQLPELFEILQRLYDIAREDRERVEYASDMAVIAEAALDDPDKAIELWEDVLVIAPNDHGAVHELQRLLLAHEKWQSLAEAYERELRMGVEDPARRLELHKLAGRLWKDTLDDPFQAQTAWQAAREEEPYDKDALDALRVIHKESGNDVALAEVIEASLVSEHYTVDTQLALWRQLANLRTEVFADANGAIEAWRAVLELSLGDPEAIEQLEQLYETEGRWDDAVALYRIKLGVMEDDDARLETWIALGAIQQENLSDIEAAAETYREILSWRPENLEASQRLEAIYEQTANWQHLATLLLERNEHLGDAEERLANLQRLARIYEERLAQPDSAFLVLQRANQELPEETTVIAELERLAAITGQWLDLHEVYESTLRHLEGDAALELMLKSARVVRDQLGDAETAILLYERVLEANEENEPALRALVELNEQGEHWEALVPVLAGLAEVTPDYGEKLTLVKHMAGVWENRLGNRDKAVDAWNQLLELDEMDREALAALQRLHVEREDWEALIDVLDRIAVLEPEREGELRLEVAGILEAHLGRADEAITVYEDVLAYDMNNVVAMERLEALYGERNDWSKLVDLYERAFNAAQDDEQRIKMARNVALLQEAVFDDPVAAADGFHRILLIAPNDDDAFESLQKIYTNRAEWDDLISLHEMRYNSAPDVDGRAEALLAMARVYRDRLDDVDNAKDMFERVLQERRGDGEALGALDTIYRAQELWEQVIENAEHMLEFERDLETRVAILCAQGEVSLQELEDTYRAASSYQRVLKEQPGNATAVEALIRIYQSEDRWDKVVEILQHKFDNASNDMLRADIQVDLAEAYSQKLAQPDAAVAALERAAQLDPESRRALWTLAEHYMREKEWVKAMPLLDPLVDKLDADDDKEQLCRVHKHLGLCAEQLYQFERALDELRIASGLMPPDRDTLMALARLNYKKESYAEAERYLQQVVDKYKSDLSSEELISIYMQLGESALMLGHIEQAQKHLQNVVREEPHNANALGQIVQVLQAHGDWKGAIAYMEQLLLLKGDDLERYQLQLSIGEVYDQRLGDRAAAAAAYRAALDLGVFPKEPALKLVELAVADQDFVEAIRHLNRLISIEEDAKRRAQFAFTAAVLYRDQLNDMSQAIKYFNLSLDNNLTNLKAFETIDTLLTAAKEWKPLEQNYRRMIQRVQKVAGEWEEAPKLLFMLYKNLGEIYRSRLKRLDYAISAFELARKQRPRDEAVREILASLYELTKDGAPRAIENHRFLVQQRPDRIDSYHRLVDLFKKVGQADSAWAVAGLLVTLGQANEQERHFYETYVSPGMSEPHRVIDHTMWMQSVMSRGEDPELGRIFELIYIGLGKNLPSKKDKEFNLKKKNRLDLNDGMVVCSAARSVVRMFGLQAPDFYRGEEATGIEILPTNPPCIRLGTDMMSGRSDKELAFYIAKFLSYFHPSHIIATVYGREALDHLYMAAASLVDPNYQLVLRDDLAASEQQLIAQTVGDLKQVLEKSMAPEVRQQLTAVMQSFWSRNPAPDTGRWHRHIELTANHAGLVASGDVALVGQLIKGESTALSKLKNSEKLKEIVQYVISEPYLLLRRQLGVGIDYSELLG